MSQSDCKLLKGGDWFNNWGIAGIMERPEEKYLLKQLWLQTLPTSTVLVVQSLSRVRPHGLQHTKFPVLHHFPEFAHMHIHWVSDAIEQSHCLLPPSPFAFNLFQWVGSSHQVARVCSFSFSISPSSEYSGLISFRIDCFDLLAVQGTLKSLLQHHNSKTSILHHSAFFMVQLSCLYMTTGKTIALTIWTFVSRVMPLLFNPLSRFVIAFLLRSKYLLMGNPKSLPPQHSPLYSQQ